MLNNKPLVSIVTVSYNRGNYIEETIKSVLEQDYPNIEYIIMDGGSTDNTIEIVKKYEGKLKWISEKDRGIEDALNKGFRIARGEIFGWVHSDDTYMQGAISKVVDFFNRYPEVKMVYGKGYFVGPSGNIIGVHPTEPFNLKRLAIANYICHPATFIKRDTFYEVGGYSMELRHSTDYDLWIKVAKKYNVKYLPEFIATFRIHEESKSISEKSVLAGYRESLELVRFHYNWAPASRVFAYYYHLLRSRLPSWIADIRSFILFLTFIVAPIQYLRLNKGIRLDDLRLIKFNDIKRLFAGWDMRDMLKEEATSCGKGKVL